MTAPGEPSDDVPEHRDPSRIPWIPGELAIYTAVVFAVAWVALQTMLMLGEPGDKWAARSAYGPPIIAGALLMLAVGAAVGGALGWWMTRTRRTPPHE